MESIENFKNHKIDDMHSVVGGRTMIPSHSKTTGDLEDKNYYNKEGCLTKVKFWDEGVKYVSTYAGDCQNGYNGSDPIDGNKATREYLKNRTNSAY